MASSAASASRGASQPAEPQQPQLSFSALSRLGAAAANRESRVRAYTLDGVQVGLADVGEGNQRLTFPACYLVGDALRAPAQHWVRFASAEEEAQTGRWYAPAGFQPAALLYENGVVAAPLWPIGLEGCKVSVLAQDLTLSEEKPCADVNQDLTLSEEKPCADVDEIKTPPTRPPVFR